MIMDLEVFCKLKRTSCIMETIIISIIILEVTPWHINGACTAPLGASKYTDCVYKFNSNLV